MYGTKKEYASAQKKRTHCAQPSVTSVSRSPQVLNFTPRREDVNEALKRNFKAGFLLGLVVGLFILIVALWGWVIPTMDNAIAQTQEAAARYEAMA